MVSGSRIADYIGIAKGDLPRKEYYGRWRTFPATCDYSFQEAKPSGFYRTYDGVTVYDGTYPYGGTRLTPSWGGSMFEALMPALFVPEERWGAGWPHAAATDLARLEALPGMYGTWGFRESVNVTTGHPSDSYLSLDQGMVMAALGNALGDDVIRRDFVDRTFRLAIRPVLGVEEFGVRPRGCMITGTRGNDVLRGTRQADVICGRSGDDQVAGLGGNDTIYGDAGNDWIRAGAGDDTAYGDKGDDITRGGFGEDVLAGGPGADDLGGGPGRDHLDGQGGGGTCHQDAADDEPGDC